MVQREKEERSLAKVRRVVEFLGHRAEGVLEKYFRHNARGR